jgi:hypothetical protein
VTGWSRGSVAWEPVASDDSDGGPARRVGSWTRSLASSASRRRSASLRPACSSSCRPTLRFMLASLRVTVRHPIESAGSIPAVDACAQPVDLPHKWWTRPWPVARCDGMLAAPRRGSKFTGKGVRARSGGGNRVWALEPPRPLTLAGARPAAWQATDKNWLYGHRPPGPAPRPALAVRPGSSHATRRSQADSLRQDWSSDGSRASRTVYTTVDSFGGATREAVARHCPCIAPRQTRTPKFDELALPLRPMRLSQLA